MLETNYFKGFFIFFTARFDTMINDYKIVRDPIHGDIKIDGIFLQLLESPEIQRLYNVKQLGFAHLVFPGAHHTRLEHSLGTFHIACQLSEILGLETHEQEMVTIAALVHDIGHGPFSHTLESILIEKMDVDHVDLTEKLITGEYEIFDNNEKPVVRSHTVYDILKDKNIDIKTITDIIHGNTEKTPYLSQILNSTIDVDQLDYLMRDAYYTGVAYGMIDLKRVLQTLTIHEQNLAVKRKGVGVLENIFMARGLMYSSVYFHKTVRIAELMLSKALHMLPHLEPFEIFRMTDAEIMNRLKNTGSFQHEIVTRLKYRQLFKQAFSLSSTEIKNYDHQVITNLENSEVRHQKEHEIEQELAIPAGHVIIDIPLPELHQAEPRINKTDIGIIDKDTVKTLDDYTPIAQAIRLRIAPDWAVMIITDECYRERVSQHAEKVLFH